MRRIVAAIAPACLLLLAVPTWAHEGPEELGHHWGVAAYRHEMWFQVLAMGLAIGLYVVGVFAFRAWKRWSIYRR
jgi:hypothetical protein